MKKLMLVVVAVLAVGGCKKKSSNNAAAMTKMTAFKDEMCKCTDAKCAQDVSDRMQKWTAEQPKDQKRSEADDKQAKAIGDEIGKCMSTATAASTPPPPATGSDVAPAGSAGSAAPAEATMPGLPKECAEYKAQVEKLKPCEKLPPKAKEALIKAFNDAWGGWQNMSETARKGLDKSCKAGTQAIVDAAKEACGW